MKLAAALGACLAAALSLPVLSAQTSTAPELAQALHRAIVRLLSERLAATNRLIQRLDP